MKYSLYKSDKSESWQYHASMPDTPTHSPVSSNNGTKNIQCTNMCQSGSNSQHEISMSLSPIAPNTHYRWHQHYRWSSDLCHKHMSKCKDIWLEIRQYHISTIHYYKTKQNLIQLNCQKSRRVHELVKEEDELIPTNKMYTYKVFILLKIINPFPVHPVHYIFSQHNHKLHCVRGIL